MSNEDQIMKLSRKKEINYEKTNKKVNKNQFVPFLSVAQIWIDKGPTLKEPLGTQSVSKVIHWSKPMYLGTLFNQ